MKLRLLFLLCASSTLNLLLVAWAAPAEQYVEGEVLVTLKESTNIDIAKQTLASHSLEFAKPFVFLSQLRNKQSGLVRSENRTTASLIAELSKDPAVETVEPNYLRWIDGATPNDPFFPQMWGLQNTGQSVNGTSGTLGADIKFLGAWAMARPVTIPIPATAEANALITFQVNMTQQISLGSFTHGSSVVSARGSFNGWGTSPLTNNPSATNSALYSGTFKDASDPKGGKLAYKYYIDTGDNWELPDSICGANRTASLPLSSGSSMVLPAFYFNDQGPTATPVTNKVTFQADMSQQILLGNFIPGTSVVSVRGSFNGWGTTPMTNNPVAASTNLYTAVVTQSDPIGNVERYKFYIDTGDRWENPILANQDCTGNRYYHLLNTNGSLLLPPILFDDEAPAITNNVTFQVDMSAQVFGGRFMGGTDIVETRGSFNGWVGGFGLTNNPVSSNTNLYTGVYKLVGAPMEQVAYKYVVDGSRWEQPASTGGNNRTFNLLATNGPEVLPAVYFSDQAPSNLLPVVVAVIDTGVDYNHPDLAANMWINLGEVANNGQDDDSNGYVDDYHGYDFADGVANPSDSGYHGTHVAGTIAAVGNNQLGVIGVNPQARIMALKASTDGGSLPDSAIIEAIQYATMMKERGVNVIAINASFGGPGFDSVMQAAIQSAGSAGIVFCAGAGNDSTNNDTTPFYPASYRLPNMIVVAASDQNDALASFSNYGASTVDLAAPGVNILSTAPTNMPGTVSYVLQGPVSYAANALTYSGTTTGITATIHYCGLGYPTNFPAAVSNNIALMSRGDIFFADKVANAMAAGARAAIICNNQSGNFYGTLQFPSNWIPSVSISQADGQALQAVLPTTGTVASYVDPTMIYQFLDGTSMATPHVAGAVSFLAMNFPSETVAQRIQRLLANVDQVANLQGKVRTGGRLNLLRTVDTDANGLPDWWELAYFGHLTGTDPSADPDHDGAINLAEWLAGTSPTDASSALRLTVPTLTQTSGIIIRWQSVAGKFYRLERSTNLATGFNTIVRMNIAATPPTNSEPDTAVLSGNQRYYRIRLEQ